MDWRKRNYYLVYTDPFAYQMRHRYYQLVAPSLALTITMDTIKK